MTNNDSGTLYERFQTSCARHPKKLALVCGPEQIAFSDLYRLVNLLTADLSSLSPLPGEAVGVCTENGFLMPAYAIACSRLKLTLVPLAPGWTVDQVSGVLSIARPALIAMTAQNKSKISRALEDSNHSVKGTLIYLDSCFADWRRGLACEKSRVESRIKPAKIDDCFVMNFTSGSTGIPKAVCVPERVKLLRIESGTIDLFNLSENEVVLIATPQYHSLGFRQSLLPLVLGCTGVVMESFSAEKWLELTIRWQVSFFVAVSSQLARIVDQFSRAELAGLSSLKTIVSSSAPFTEAQRKACRQSFDCRIFEIYGTSEVGIASIKQLRINQPESLSIGISIPSVSIRLFDPQTRASVVGEGHVGEICVSSPYAFSQYFGRDDLYHSAHLEGFFATGDLAYRDKSGELFFAGRLYDTIQVSGITVYPIDIETVLKNIEGVSDACVIGVSDVNFGERIEAIYASAHVLDENEIYRILLKRLAAWQIPKRLHRLDAIPLTPIGKVDRALLKELVANDFRGSSDNV